MDSVPAFADSIDPLSVFLLAANVPWTLTLSISLFILLAVYYMISGGLVALFSLGPRDINVLKTKQHPPAKRIVSLLEEPKLVYTSVLIAGIVISICIILIAAFLINQYLPFGSLKVLNSDLVSYMLELLLRVLAIAFVLVFVGEILPKVNATQKSLRFAYTSSFVVELIHLLFKRVSMKMVNVADSISHRLGGDKHMSSASLKELDNELELDDNETASEEEKNILRGIIKFPNISVKQIMTSRLDVSGIEWSTSFNQLIQRIEELHYSRLPVYKKSLDDVAGIIHTKDMIPFLDQPDDFDWRPLMRSALYVHEAKLIKDLLRDFQNKRVHFAIVVDEFGGTSGIVTMEDILEEIVGDIQDEFDEEEVLIKQVGETAFVVAGKATLVDLCRGMQLPLDTFEEVRGDSETVAGLVLELAGEFPKQDEKITSADFIFTILSTSKNRIQQVKVEYEKPSK